MASGLQIIPYRDSNGAYVGSFPDHVQQQAFSNPPSQQLSLVCVQTASMPQSQQICSLPSLSLWPEGVGHAKLCTLQHTYLGCVFGHSAA